MSPLRTFWRRTTRWTRRVDREFTDTYVTGQRDAFGREPSRRELMLVTWGTRLTLLATGALVLLGLGIWLFSALT